MLELPILWQDEDVLVINKPPFVVVNRAESIKGETVQDWADARSQKPEDRSQNLEATKLELDRDVVTFRKRSGVAHRLDKETSGCLLIAKNPIALKSLLKQFKDREIKKEYLALVHGHMVPSEGTIRLPLSRSRFDREKWEIKYSGKSAETSWKVERYYKDASLVRLFPKTGRTHQIRVHLSHMGYPIFSDEKYLTKSLVRGDREKLSFHFLHASKIGFRTQSGEWKEIEADLPIEANKLLRWMESE